MAAEAALRHVSAQSKQQEPFTSGNHLQACGCRQKETVWNSLGWFLPRRFFLLHPRLLFSVPVYSLWKWPLTAHCEPLFSSSLFTSRVNDVVLVSGCFDANGGCSVGGASCLMSSKCLAVAERCLVPLTGDEEWGGGLAEKGCPGWLTSRCVWELPWAQKIVWENALM